MRSRLFTVTIVLSVFFACLLGFFTFAESDAQLEHGGDVYVMVSNASDPIMNDDGSSSSTLLVDAPPADEAQTATAADAFQSMSDVADAHHVAVVRIATDVFQPDTKRTLYVYAAPDSGAAATWVSKGYPDFAPFLMSTTVEPLTDSEALGATGEYRIVGGSRSDRTAAILELADRLPGMGYGVTAEHIGLVRWAQSQPVQLAVGAVLSLLLCALLAAMFALLNAQGYAIMRLHGYTGVQMWRRDIAVNARGCAIGAGIVLIVALCAVGIGNHFAQWTLYLITSAAFLLTILLFVALFHTGCMRLTGTQPVLSGLKGSIPVGRATLDVYVVRVPAALVAMSTVSALMVAGAAVGRDRARLDYWGDQGGVAYVNAFRTSTGETAYNTWLMGKIQSGEVIRSYETTLSDIKPQVGSDSENLPAVNGDVLIVNSQYLTRQTILDDSGNRITSIPESKVLLIIPAERSADAEDIEKVVTAHCHHTWVEAQLERVYGVDYESVVDENDNEFTSQSGAEIETMTGQAGQRLFGYRTPDTAASSMDMSIDAVFTPLESPIVIGIDPSSGVDSTFEYLIEHGSMFFPNRDQLWNELKAAGLDSVVAQVATPTDSIRADMAREQGTLRLALASFVLGVVVLVASGVALARTNVQGRRQKVFAEYIHGWPFARMHLTLIVCELALFGALTVNGVNHYHQLLQYYDPMTGAYQFNPAMSIMEVVVVCAVSVATCFIATAVATRRLCVGRARGD